MTELPIPISFDLVVRSEGVSFGAREARFRVFGVKVADTTLSVQEWRSTSTRNGTPGSIRQCVRLAQDAQARSTCCSRAAAMKTALTVGYTKHRENLRYWGRRVHRFAYVLHLNAGRA